MLADPAAGGQDATVGAADGAADAAEVPEMSEPEEAAEAGAADEAEAKEEEAEGEEEEEHGGATPFELDVGMLAVAGLLIMACLAMVVRLCGREVKSAQTLESKYQQLRADRRRAAVYGKP